LLLLLLLLRRRYQKEKIMKGHAMKTQDTARQGKGTT
jgi:hypothetical protein